MIQSSHQGSKSGSEWEAFAASLFEEIKLSSTVIEIIDLDRSDVSTQQEGVM